jgi:hypothetical protein
MFADVTEHLHYLGSNVYKDHIAEINIWIKIIHEKMETEEDQAELFRLQGSAKACRNFLIMAIIKVDELRSVGEALDELDIEEED